MVPMNVVRYEEHFQKRLDPWGREYFWLVGGPSPATAGGPTDRSALDEGKVTITPLGLQPDAPAGARGNGPLAVSPARVGRRRPGGRSEPVFLNRASSTQETEGER